MPSDSRMAIALRALAGPVEVYRSAVAATAEEARGYLAGQRSGEDGAEESAAAELGPFAAGRIDVRRFAGLLDRGAAVDAGALERVERASELLSDVAARGDDAFCSKVAAGQRLRDVVARHWEEWGRAFGAARVVALTMRGGLEPGTDDRLFGPLGFVRWSEDERRLAPPLAIELDGADLRAADLIEFLDGGVKIVLVVRGASPPAPLVRLITPATFVLQTAGEAGLDRFAAAEGPAVAALVPESGAQFVHDPGAGAEPWQRIEIMHVPEQEPRRAIGGMSVRQQSEELKQLLTLARGPARAAGEGAAAEGEPATAATAATAAVEDPVERLAAWLLSQADLDDLE